MALAAEATPLGRALDAIDCGGLWQAFTGYQKALHYPLVGPHLSANASVGSYCAFHPSEAATVLPVLAEGVVCFSSVFRVWKSSLGGGGAFTWKLINVLAPVVALSSSANSAN